MHCASCVALIEETLAALPGVVRSTVDLESNRGAVTFEPASTTVGAICAAVTSIGYVATPLAAGSAPE
jgi:copper chaperone CopZ